MDNKLNLSFIFLKGVVQGIVTGIRGLCNGLGPALFGLIFYIFHVNLTDNNKLNQDTKTAFTGLKEVKVQEPKGLRGMFSVLNQFRREGSLGDVFDTVGSITLIVNPLFLFLAFISFVVLLLLTFVMLLVVIF